MGSVWATGSRDRTSSRRLRRRWSAFRASSSPLRRSIPGTTPGRSPGRSLGTSSVEGSARRNESLPSKAPSFSSRARLRCSLCSPSSRRRRSRRSLCSVSPPSPSLRLLCSVSPPSPSLRFRCSLCFFFFLVNKHSHNMFNIYRRSSFNIVCMMYVLYTCCLATQPKRSIIRI